PYTTLFRSHRDPAGAVRILVDQLRPIGQLTVDLDDAAAHGRVDVGDRLDRLHHGKGFPCLEDASFLRQVDEHHVPQLMLGVVGDAHPHAVAFLPDPLVLLAVAQILGIHGRAPFYTIHRCTGAALPCGPHKAAFDDLTGNGTAADLDRELLSRRSVLRRDVAHADGFPQGWGHGAGRHAPDLSVAGQQRIPLARDAPADHAKTDQPPGDALGRLTHQRLLAHKGVLVQLDGEPQARLQRRRALVDVVAV